MSPPLIRWQENGTPHEAALLSARPMRVPARLEAVSDIAAADALRLLTQDTAILWRGDYPTVRRLLQNLGKLLDRGRRPPPDPSPAAAFNADRQRRAQRAAIIGLLLVPLRRNAIDLPRAQDVAIPLAEAIGDLPPESLMPLRDMLAFVSAHEWRRNGVAIGALGGQRIHPHYGVFPPTRQDYIDLVGTAPLPATDLAFDIGTGSGVVAAVLLHRGVAKVVATDNATPAIACATENLERLGYSARSEIIAGPLFPPGRAPLIVCNPPWLPAKSTTTLESAVYDPQSQMLRGFLAEAAAHLTEGGEAWLIMSNLAELLSLRAPDEMSNLIAAGGLVVRGRLDTSPSPKGAHENTDPLHFARAQEIVSLWRLGTSQDRKP